MFARRWRPPGARGHDAADLGFVLGEPGQRRARRRQPRGLNSAILYKSEQREAKKDARIQLLENQLVENYDERILAGRARGGCDDLDQGGARRGVDQRKCQAVSSWRAGSK